MKRKLSQLDWYTGLSSLYTLVAEKLLSLSGRVRQLSVAAPGSIVSFDGFLKNLFIQSQIRYQLFQPSVLLFQLLQTRRSHRIDG